MCNAFSCVALRDGTVEWQLGIDSHDYLIGTMSCKLGVDQLAVDGAFSGHFMARIEVVPDTSYLDQDGAWHIEFDLDQQPVWWTHDHGIAVDRAFGHWKSEVYSMINFRRLRELPRVMEMLRMQRDQCLMHAAENLLDTWVNGLRRYGSINLSALEHCCDQRLGHSLPNAVYSSVPYLLGFDTQLAMLNKFVASGWADMRSVLQVASSAYSLSMMMPCVPDDYQEVIEAGARLVEMGMVPIYNGETGEWTLFNGAGVYFAKTYAPIEQYGTPHLISLLPAFDPGQQIVYGSGNWVRQYGGIIRQAQLLPCQSTMDVMHAKSKFAKIKLGRQ